MLTNLICTRGETLVHLCRSWQCCHRALEKGTSFCDVSRHDCRDYKQLHGSAKGAAAGEEAGEDYIDTQEIYS